MVVLVVVVLGLLWFPWCVWLPTCVWFPVPNGWALFVRVTHHGGVSFYSGLDEILKHANAPHHVLKHYQKRKKKKTPCSVLYYMYNPFKKDMVAKRQRCKGECRKGGVPESVLGSI